MLKGRDDRKKIRGRRKPDQEREGDYQLIG
jgi:hypothetical protein